MAAILVSGTVLNQDSDNPMSGEIVERSGHDLSVAWSNGLVCWEDAGDVILTGNVKFE